MYGGDKGIVFFFFIGVWVLFLKKCAIVFDMGGGGSLFFVPLGVGVGGINGERGVDRVEGVVERDVHVGFFPRGVYTECFSSTMVKASLRCCPCSDHVWKNGCEIRILKESDMQYRLVQEHYSDSSKCNTKKCPRALQAG